MWKKRNVIKPGFMNVLRDMQNVQIRASMKSERFLWYPFLLHTLNTEVHTYTWLAAVNVFKQLFKKKKKKTKTFTILLLYYHSATVQQRMLLQTYWICLFGLTGLVQKLQHHRAMHYLVTFCTANTFLWALKLILVFLVCHQTLPKNTK